MLTAGLRCHAAPHVGCCAAAGNGRQLPAALQRSLFSASNAHRRSRSARGARLFKVGPTIPHAWRKACNMPCIIPASQINLQSDQSPSRLPTLHYRRIRTAKQTAARCCQCRRTRSLLPPFRRRRSPTGGKRSSTCMPSMRAACSSPYVASSSNASLKAQILTEIVCETSRSQQPGLVFPLGSPGAWDDAALGRPVVGCCATSASPASAALKLLTATVLMVYCSMSCEGVSDNGPYPSQVRCFLRDDEQRWCMWYSARGEGYADRDAISPGAGCIGTVCIIMRNIRERPDHQPHAHWSDHSSAIWRSQAPPVTPVSTRGLQPDQRC